MKYAEAVGDIFCADADRASTANLERDLCATVAELYDAASRWCTAVIEQLRRASNRESNLISGIEAKHTFGVDQLGQNCDGPVGA